MVSFLDLARHAGETVTVEDVMTGNPVQASEDTPIEDVARLMLDEMVRRVPIVRGETVVGIVSASDIVQVFLNLHEKPRRPNRSDGERRAMTMRFDDRVAAVTGGATGIGRATALAYGFKTISV